LPNKVPAEQGRASTVRSTTGTLLPALQPKIAELASLQIAATRADNLTLGHWDRPMRVGNGVVPAFYSGSPELARSVNLVRLTTGRSSSRARL
jgi:hypothetical protein